MCSIYLKTFADELISSLTAILNAATETYQPLQEMYQSILVAIPKLGPIHLPANLRFLTLNNVEFKLYDKRLANTIIDFATEHKIISRSQ